MWFLEVTGVYLEPELRSSDRVQIALKQRYQFASDNNPDSRSKYYSSSLVLFQVYAFKSVLQEASQ